MGFHFTRDKANLEANGTVHEPGWAAGERLVTGSPSARWGHFCCSACFPIKKMQRIVVVGRV